MKFTILKNYPHLVVEDCCNGADVILERQDWGVAWPDGVHHWNEGPIVDIKCAKCGKSLHFERIKE